MSYTKQVPVNTTGRDFVVGDLHGCFTMLQKLLAHVSFNPSYDRLFSVGDLVDRGPENSKCLSLLKEPWFYAVRGNHEDLMLESFAKRIPKFLWNNNGGGWDLEEGATELLKELMPTVDALPLFMTVDLPNNKCFHVVHADLASKGPVLTDNNLRDEEFFIKNVVSQECQDGLTLLWGRCLFIKHCGKSLTEHDIVKIRRGLVMHKLLNIYSADMSEVFCGHTTVTRPTKVGPMVNIDTHAYRADGKTSKGLTLAQPLTGKFWTNFGSDSIEQVEKLVI